jgi:hypothetical protein
VKILQRMFLTGLLWILSASVAVAAGTPITLGLHPDPGNPAAPAMGDHLMFWSTITNTGDRPLEGLVAWISLVEIDPGNEQPVDLEDWSAHKAVTGAMLGPGQSLKTEWPMRLIRGGDYRVVISVTDRNRQTVTTSPTMEFHVKQKPVLQSTRILPVAAGVPLLLVGLMVVNMAHLRRGKPRGEGSAPFRWKNFP